MDGIGGDCRGNWVDDGWRNVGLRMVISGRDIVVGWESWLVVGVGRGGGSVGRRLVRRVVDGGVEDGGMVDVGVSFWGDGSC